MSRTTLKRVHGYLAEFSGAGDVYHAAEKIRDAGFQRWDVHSPFPIHGLNEAMGVKRSILPWFVFIGGATGTITAFLLSYITQCWLYPTVVQAKPANIYTTPAFFPIMFELTILLSAFTALFGCLALMGLPRLNHPLFASKQFKKFSDDGFFVCIEARDPKFHQAETKTFLESIGARNIELVEDEL
ncbi:MAG: DUF3341 domain-containing protein [Verrucomicrobiaceae bacterium]